MYTDYTLDDATVDTVRYDGGMNDSLVDGDNQNTARMPARPIFETLRLPSWTKSPPSPGSSSSHITPEWVYIPKKNPRRSHRHSRPSSSCEKDKLVETEFVKCTTLLPTLLDESRPTRSTRHSRFTAGFTTPSYCSTSSVSSSEESSPTEELPHFFFAAAEKLGDLRSSQIRFPIAPHRVEHVPIIYDSATPPAFATPKSSPTVEREEWAPGAAGLLVFQALSRVNEKLYGEAAIRMRLEEAGKGMDRDVWERRMARRGRVAF